LQAAGRIEILPIARPAMPSTLAFLPGPEDLDEGYFDVPVLTFSPPVDDTPEPEPVVS
jgi:hypothetical protein